MGGEGKAGRMGRPPRIDGQQHTSERILEAAIDLFAERGYDRTSVRELAASLSLTESAIYRHYEGKEAILKAILSMAETSIYDPLPIEAGSGEYAGTSIFRGLLMPLPRILLANPRIVKVMRILFSEMRHDAGLRRYYQSTFVERADDYVEALFRKQLEAGALRPCDPRSLARVFNAFRANWAIDNFVFGPERTIAELEGDLEGPTAFFEKLLAAGPGGPAGQA